LSALMFRFGRPASSFDIADMLDPVVTQRDSVRTDKLKDRGTLIGSLIEEALFEFTSIEKGRETSTMFDARGTPISLGSFENVHNWASDMGDLSLSSSDSFGTGDEGSSIEIGNLAALEDDGDVVASPRAQAAQAQRNSHPQPLPTLAEKPKRTGLIIALVLVLVSATVAGLFASGIIGKSAPKTMQMK